MLIAPDSPVTAYLAVRVEVVDEETKEVVNNVFSFDTETKEAEIFIMTPDGKVAVENEKPKTEKVVMKNWNAYDKFTKQIINDGTMGTVPKG